MNRLILGAAILLFALGAKAQLRVVPYAVCNQPDGFFVSVKNVGPAGVRIKKSELPWMPRSRHVRISIYASVNGKFEKIKSVSPIFDTFYDPMIDLPPGKIYTGFMPFSSLVPDFENKNSNSEMSFFLKTQGLPFIDSLGLVSIPKSSFFNRHSCPAAGQWPS